MWLLFNTHLATSLEIDTWLIDCSSFHNYHYYYCSK